MELIHCFPFVAAGAVSKPGVTWRKTTQKHSCLRFLLCIRLEIFNLSSLTIVSGVYIFFLQKAFLEKYLFLYWKGQKPEKNYDHQNLKNCERSVTF